MDVKSTKSQAARQLAKRFRAQGDEHLAHDMELEADALERAGL
jgi:hypothetical protein